MALLVYFFLVFSFVLCNRSPGLSVYVSGSLAVFITGSPAHDILTNDLTIAGTVCCILLPHHFCPVANFAKNPQ